jgi:gas vesicle protein
MQEALIGQVYQVPQSLLALQGMVEQMIRQEISIKEANDMSKKALETTQAIKEAIISESDDWRNDIKHKVSTIQKSMNKGYQEVWTELYDELEKRGHCDLSVRVNNGRYRLENSGATKTTINNYGRLDVIEADVRLKEIFSAIVKEYTVKCVN